MVWNMNGLYFPTCQVRVVRFYQSCSPHPPPPSPPPPPPLPPPVSPRPCLHQLPRPLPPCQLVANLFANFRAQWALLDLNCRLPIWVGTAGPQPPGTFRAQWAPLDLNLGPAQLSGRWTSTWDLPSSVGTAGPQRPDRMPEDMPDRTPDRMSERMPEDMPDRMPEGMPDRMPEGMPDRMSDRMPEDMPGRMPEDMPDRMPEGMPDKVPECLPDRAPEDLPDRMPDRMSEDMPEDMPDKMPDKMPEDLPVTKRINVMLGMTRSKVMFHIGNLIIPTDELIFFRGVEATNQYIYILSYYIVACWILSCLQ